MAEQDTPPPTITAMKIPIIRKEEYDIWSMKMRQYIYHTDHNLWDVIVNGDLEEEPANWRRNICPPAPKTAKQLAAKRKSRYKNAKSPRKQSKSRFGRNEESMKMQKKLTLAVLMTFSYCSGDFGMDGDDLEELDLRWQVAMLTVRVKKFIQRTRMNLDFKEKRTVSLDKTKIECYNCHKKGHFARECRSRRNQGRRSYGDNGRSNAPTNESSSHALVAQDVLGGYD
ncbi:ribonuclease H-like domain-containing protein [Tanacetum coccineum]